MRKFHDQMRTVRYKQWAKYREIMLEFEAINAQINADRINDLIYYKSKERCKKIGKRICIFLVVLGITLMIVSIWT